MPPGLKQRGTRLGYFVHAPSSQDRVDNGDPAHEEAGPEEHPETPQVNEPAPTRQELADAARVPLPKTSRHVTNHLRETSVPKQSAPPSPRKEAQTSHSPIRGRVDPNMQRGGLFEGSQLGESFMYSGRTSPQDFSDFNDVEPYQEARIESAKPAHRSQGRNRLDVHADENDHPAFQIADDGSMRVVVGGARHNTSHMHDGFHNGAPNGHQRSSSSLERSKLPMREVKIRKPRTDMHDDYKVKGDRRAMSPSTQVVRRDAWPRESRAREFRPWDEETKRPAAFLDLEEDVGKRRQGAATPPKFLTEQDLDSGDEHEELQMTPKAKMNRESPQKRLVVSSMPANAVVPYYPSKQRKRRRASPDYDDQALNSMTYGELQQEPFDVDPAKAIVQNGHGAEGDKLEGKLEQSRQQGGKEQQHMFATMSIDDWEASGDWFVDQFAEIMKKMKGARQNKRRMIQDFEDEASHREEAVRLRSEAVDRKLAKMRQNGQRVVEARDI